MKKTGMSFWTALIGAVVNIAFNIILIPTYGAIGASIATLVSYFVVFLVRALTMHRFIPFNMYPIRLAINTILITAIAVVMTGWGDSSVGILIACSVLAVSLVLNGRDIFFGCRDILLSMKSKKRKE